MAELWVKICGITDLAAARAAVRAGADAIGFVFAPSPRRVDLSTAARIAGQVEGSVAIVAVSRHPEPAQWLEIVQNLKPDYVQTDAEDWQGPLAGMRLPEGCRQIHVIRNRMPAAGNVLQLFESASSGSGEQADWQMAAQAARRAPVVLAGGLSPDNVAEAVTRVRPFGVDVSSGVETAPGIKSPLLIERFVMEARRAATEAALGGQA